jgi:hypothetical protein
MRSSYYFIDKNIAVKSWVYEGDIKVVYMTEKLGGCYFSLVLFSKSALRLIFKIKTTLFEITA